MWLEVTIEDGSRMNRGFPRGTSCAEDVEDVRMRTIADKRTRRRRIRGYYVRLKDPIMTWTASSVEIKLIELVRPASCMVLESYDEHVIRSSSNNLEYLEGDRDPFARTIGTKRDTVSPGQKVKAKSNRHLSPLLISTT